MKHSEKCPACGHIATAYAHHLNIPLVSALRQLVDFYEKRNRSANLQMDLNLTKNQYNNFQKLQYFGLVRRITEGWLPTEKGIDFIYGKKATHNRVVTIESKILGDDHPAMKGVKRKTVMVHDVDRTSYKRREEYQLEKVNTLFKI